MACVTSWAMMSCDRQVNTELPRQVQSGVGLAGAEVAEQNGVERRIEEGICSNESMRHEPEARTAGMIERDRPAERAARCLDHFHGYGVHHLLMELRVLLVGLQAVPHQDGGFVEVDGVVVALVAAVVVDDLHDFPLRARLQVRLVLDVDGDALAGAPAAHGIAGVDLQPASFGRQTGIKQGVVASLGGIASLHVTSLINKKGHSTWWPQREKAIGRPGMRTPA